MIAIIDYGLGNLGSIANMLKAIDVRPIITDMKEELEQAEKLILPGVGAFDVGMTELKNRGLIPVIKELVNGGKPILGICLGMQLLGEGSEEGKDPGLGFIPFKSKRFDFSKADSALLPKLKVPHMGWDIVDFKKESPLLKGIKGQQRYYFVHSYHAVCKEERDVLMTCDYGYPFAAAVSRDNIYGVQFHPEKSHDFGMRLLQNYVERC